MITQMYDQQQAARADSIAANVATAESFGATAPAELAEAVRRVANLRALIRQAPSIEAVIDQGAHELFDSARADRDLKRIVARVAQAQAEVVNAELALEIVRRAASAADVDAITLFKRYADTLIDGMQPRFDTAVQQLRELSARLPLGMDAATAIYDDQHVTDWRNAEAAHDDYVAMRQLRSGWENVNLIAGRRDDECGFNVMKNANEINTRGIPDGGVQRVLELLRRGAELWLPNQRQHFDRVDEYLRAHRREVLAARGELRHVGGAFGPGLDRPNSGLPVA